MKKEEMRSRADMLIAKSPLAKTPFRNTILADAFPKEDPADPVPEEPKTADQTGEPEKRGRRIKKVALEEKYSRQTYWLRKEYIQKVQDYAFTEDINLRQAINRLLSVAFDEIEKQYKEEGKELLHYDERKDYEYDYL